MFHEYPCGCNISQAQGRVRVCQEHAGSADGIGGLSKAIYPRGKASKLYPANGYMPASWAGR